MERTDVIVIGAGIAGLTAARTARAAGASVVVLDGQPAGGRARSDERDGFIFNRGPHALYRGGAAERVLDGFGITLTGGAPGSLQGRRGDVISDLPAGMRTLATTRLLGAKGKLAVAKVLGGLGKWKAVDHRHRTAAEFVDGLGMPADAAGLLHMLIRVATYANAPETLSAEVAVGQVQMAMTHGVRYLDGGWQSIVAALSAGLDVRRAAVSAIGADSGDLAIAVAGGDESWVARQVVIAAGTPQATAALLGRERFEIGPPIEAACLDLGLRRPVPSGGLMGIDHPLYLSTHCPPARLAPPGHVLAHAARYLAPGDSLPPDAQRAELMDHVHAAGVADEDIVADRYLHRMTVVGGMATAAGGGLAGRPGIADTGIAGCWIAGDWVGPEGHLADASFASGHAAGRAAVAGLD